MRGFEAAQRRYDLMSPPEDDERPVRPEPDDAPEDVPAWWDKEEAE